MSVINKVLRDLDSRAPQPPLPEGVPVDCAPVTRGTARVDPLPPPAPGRVPGAAAWAALAVLVLGGALWWWLGRGAGTAPLPAPVAAVPTLPASAQASVEPAPQAGMAVPAASAAVAGPVAPATPAAGPVPPARVAAAPALAPASMPVASVPRPQAATSPPRQSLAGAPPLAGPASASVTAPVAAAVAGPAAGAASAAAPVRQSAATAAADAVRPGPRADPPLGAPNAAPPPAWPEVAMEALAQAQRTWNSGARDAAIEFLTDALASVERAHGREWAGGGAAAQAPLAMVRELARMATVQGQHAMVLELLRRHERLVAQQADLWAVRGSAGQRLSQHADSAQSYQMALRLRPGEPRWMLGVAVSLAAQGQTGPAAEWAEQARSAGPVSAEVLAYLRQLGVVVRDR